MKRLKPEIVDAGLEFMSHLITATAQSQMGGLGGCKLFSPEDYPEDMRPYVLAYVNDEMESVEACYLYMQSKEIEST